MTTLIEQPCEACRGDLPAMTEAEANALLAQLPGWQLEPYRECLTLVCRFPFSDFAEALAFTNQVGALAETAGHHPELLTEWGAVSVRWYTHKILGLQQNDFVCAAHTLALYSPGSDQG